MHVRQSEIAAELTLPRRFVVCILQAGLGDRQSRHPHDIGAVDFGLLAGGLRIPDRSAHRQRVTGYFAQLLPRLFGQTLQFGRSGVILLQVGRELVGILIRSILCRL